MNVSTVGMVRAAAALSLCFCGSTVLAAVDAMMRIEVNDVTTNYRSSAAAPNILSAAGTLATLQFSATPMCVNAACSIDGPAVGAYLGAGSASQAAESTLRYDVGIVGAPGLVPILVSGLYATYNPPANPLRLGGTVAVDVLRVFSSAGNSLFNFRSLCYNYDPNINEQGPAENCGSGSFGGSFLAAAGFSLSVYMNALASRPFEDRLPMEASAYIDPYFEIDPVWAALHPGYSLAFDTGVGNGIPGGFNGVAPVPEPETWALMAAGLATLALLRRRRART